MVDVMHATSQCMLCVYSRAYFCCLVWLQPNHHRTYISSCLDHNVNFYESLKIHTASQHHSTRFERRIWANRATTLTTTTKQSICLRCKYNDIFSVTGKGERCAPFFSNWTINKYRGLTFWSPKYMTHDASTHRTWNEPITQPQWMKKHHKRQRETKKHAVVCCVLLLCVLCDVCLVGWLIWSRSTRRSMQRMLDKKTWKNIRIRYANNKTF